MSQTYIFPYLTRRSTHTVNIVNKERNNGTGYSTWLRKKEMTEQLIVYHWRRKRGGGGGGRGKGGMSPPTFLTGGGQWYVCAPPLLTPNFYFPLELYVYITLTNNNLAFFIYQLIILSTITIK